MVASHSIQIIKKISTMMRGGNYYMTDTGIYKITCVPNGKIYVGCSRDIHRRFCQQITQLKGKRHYNDLFQKDFDRYGDNNFIVETLEICSDNELFYKERIWIKKLKSEYEEFGYNKAYNITNFDNYKTAININYNNREVNVIEFTDAIKESMSVGIRKYFSNSDNRLKLSLSKTTISRDTVLKIKKHLANDINITSKEISLLYNVGLNIVNHIVNIQSHELLASEYNHIIKNRATIKNNRVNKKMLQMYRDGKTYQSIADYIGLDIRNVIRRLKNIINKHDERCRYNVYKRKFEKRERIVKTYRKLGYTKLEISKRLKISRNTVDDILDDKLILKNKINEIRKMPNAKIYVA
ncbi:hypothetical protein DOS79_03190 [Staphylococcus felis]|uniref:GIY-YIG domain-containing protein n=2 Tax=Staphylococcus felis TaxID=46127 RepID=A0AAX1RVH5_9STAP|nr:hypothetical protein DOS59_08850 [Staphylococcus felis]REH83877.1 hypothetical protein DOS56_05330 [Staphylococcus felis]REH99017.1 hypothetical protein DOS64_10105 [Staphylococcus felis]REI15425.1 hypothetical protein DOS75_09620 [Staphylococcus felis]REI22235.1 hypothetical protein DOS76_05755 [Staphylococcus felis]